MSTIILFLMNDSSPLPVESELILLKEQLDTLQASNTAQEQALTELHDSDARQWRLLRYQRKLQSICIAALALAIAVGFAGFSDGNRETLERIVVGIVGAAAAGHVGSNFVDKIPESEQR